MKIKKCKIFEKGMFFKLQFRKIAEDLKSWREKVEGRKKEKGEGRKKEKGEGRKKEKGEEERTEKEGRRGKAERRQKEGRREEEGTLINPFVKNAPGVD